MSAGATGRCQPRPSTAPVISGCPPPVHGVGRRVAALDHPANYLALFDSDLSRVTDEEWLDVPEVVVR